MGKGFLWLASVVLLLMGTPRTALFLTKYQADEQTEKVNKEQRQSSQEHSLVEEGFSSAGTSC